VITLIMTVHCYVNGYSVNRWRRANFEPIEHFTSLFISTRRIPVPHLMQTYLASLGTQRNTTNEQSKCQK